jgi:hypothetical protein
MARFGHADAPRYDGANHGFLIRDATASGSGEQRLHSRERRTNRPQLVISFTPIG